MKRLYTDDFLLGVVAYNISFFVGIHRTDNFRRRLGYNLDYYAEIPLGKKPMLRDTVDSFLLENDIVIGKGKRRIKRPESLINLFEILEPFRHILDEPRIRAIEYILNYPPPYNDIEAFKDYVSRVEVLLEEENDMDRDI
tara:strand:- start:186 stop:605 length:420 start_codon:yes stop_codon:yes gene_type:complete